MSEMVYKIFVIILISVDYIKSEVFLRRGFYTAHLTSIEDCQTPGTGDFIFHLRLSKVNLKTANIVGNVTLKTALDDSLQVVFVMDSWGNLGWRLNSFVTKMNNPCSGIKNFIGEGLRKILATCKSGECTTKKSNDPLCPILPGYYETTGIDESVLTEANIPAATPGKWRFTLKLYNRDSSNLIACIRATVFTEAARFVRSKNTTKITL